MLNQGISAQDEDRTGTQGVSRSGHGAVESFEWRSAWTPAWRGTLLLFLLTGLIYPLLVTGVAQGVFPEQANGSLVKDEKGALVGSRLIGQPFQAAGYFHGRLSAAGSGYDGMASSGSNLGPTSEVLTARVVAEVARLKQENPGQTEPVPVSLVTASGSGLDPQLPVEAVMWQLPRVAAVRGVPVARLKSLVESRVEAPVPGLGGTPMVNVLELNLSLDRQVGAMDGRP